MNKQKQMTERELPQSVELSDEELDGVAGGLAAFAIVNALKARYGGRVGQLNDRGENGDLH